MELIDGTYLTNHVFHPDGCRERIVEIINGSVIVNGTFFSQKHFFDVNYIIKKI